MTTVTEETYRHSCTRLNEINAELDWRYAEVEDGDDCTKITLLENEWSSLVRVINAYESQIPNFSVF